MERMKEKIMRRANEIKNSHHKAAKMKAPLVYFFPFKSVKQSFKYFINKNINLRCHEKERKKNAFN
jgi:hypothetical protein